jgi:hypothetical protein
VGGWCTERVNMVGVPSAYVRGWYNRCCNQTETIFYNIILIKLTLKKCIKVKSIKVNLGKRNLSYSIVNTIGGKYLRALKRPNKSRKYNSNTPKNRSNRIKKLALLN